MSRDEPDAGAAESSVTGAAESSAQKRAPGTDAGGDATDVSYEAARAELGSVMRALESGGQSLEESLALWRRGEDLADVCQRWLDEASSRLDEAIAARAHAPDSAR